MRLAPALVVLAGDVIGRHPKKRSAPGGGSQGLTWDRYRWRQFGGNQACSPMCINPSVRTTPPDP
ncbi:MAG: hypothetical protein MAG471_01427 [Acidimicrobiaceae bacterium]|nr:hypothetical protein [Acidimicrobiaceae bacterium]